MDYTFAVNWVNGIPFYLNEIIAFLYFTTMVFGGMHPPDPLLQRPAIQ